MNENTEPAKLSHQRQNIKSKHQIRIFQTQKIPQKQKKIFLHSYTDGVV